MQNVKIPLALNFGEQRKATAYFKPHGNLLLIIGVFIIPGGLHPLALALVGLAVTGVFVLGSMAVGKLFFRL